MARLVETLRSAIIVPFAGVPAAAAVRMHQGYRLRLTLAATVIVCYPAVLVLQQLRPISFGNTSFSLYMIICAIVASVLWAASAFYALKRKDEALSAMLSGIGFLVPFAMLITPLSHYAFLWHGPYIDPELAAADRAIGSDWPALMEWAARHPWLIHILKYVYSFAAEQVLLLVVILGALKASDEIDSLCVSAGLGGILTVAIWVAFPSFGAVAVYGVPHAAAGLKLVMDEKYTQSLRDMLAHGPAAVSCLTTKGVVGFPSYHALESVIACWYARRSRWLFGSFLVVNVLALVSMPIEGGHHLVDLIGGCVLAVVTLVLVRSLKDNLSAGASLARLPHAVTA